MRFLLDGGDEPRRLALRLSAPAGAPARLVIEEPTCLSAADAYARVARPAAGLHPPFPVAVVEVGEQYLVQLGGLTPAEADTWELALFDRSFRLLALEPPRR